MPMTLLESAKFSNTDALKSGVVELYAGSSDILMNLPFMDIQGNAMKYNTEQTMPGVGFRGINEGYTESVGVINQQTESLVISGGDLDVDKFIVDTQGNDARAMNVASKTRALGLAWTKKFFKGDANTDPREFDGIQKRLSGAQIIDAGSSSGGDALSLFKLDELVDQVLNPSCFVMNKTMKRWLSAAARNPSVSGYITYSPDQFGNQQMQYQGLPILLIDLDNDGSSILPFNEAGSGGGSAVCTSIYCLSLGEDGVMGLQNGGMDVRDIGELESKPVLRTRIEWYSGLAIFNGRGAARLRGVKSAAVVA